MAKIIIILLKQYIFLIVFFCSSSEWLVWVIRYFNIYVVRCNVATPWEHITYKYPNWLCLAALHVVLRGSTVLQLAPHAAYDSVDIMGLS